MVLPERGKIRLIFNVQALVTSGIAAAGVKEMVGRDRFSALRQTRPEVQKKMGLHLGLRDEIVLPGGTQGGQRPLGRMTNWSCIVCPQVGQRTTRSAVR